jgi:TolA-binding protein
MIWEAKKIKFVSVLFLFLGGCALPATKVEVGKSQRDISDLRSIQGSQTARMASLESQMRELQGRIDELEHSIGRQVKIELESFKEMLVSIQNRIPPPSLVPLKQLEEDELKAAAYEAEIAQPLLETFAALRMGNYSRARDALALVSQFARGKNEREILFWSAITFEGLADFRNALATYHDFSSKFPKDNRAPLVLMRQANTLVRLGDNKTAVLILKKLQTDWPKSSEAAAAKERIRSLE